MYSGSRRLIDVKALRQAFSRQDSMRGLRVALVVGTILNVINQGSQFSSPGEIDIMRAMLTYAVPYFVATYGAYSAYRQKA